MSSKDFIDKVNIEFTLYVTDNKLPSYCGNIDSYWWNVYDGSNTYHNLCNVAFCVMTVAVTNVEAERGFSINKHVLDDRCSLSEDTLIAIRFVKDTIQHFGKNVAEFPITHEML